MTDSSPGPGHIAEVLRDLRPETIGRKGTFSLVAQFMVVLPQLGDELSSLQLNLGVGGQVVGGRALSDHSIGLNVQIPVDAENTGGSFVQHEETQKLRVLTGRAWLQYSHSWPVRSRGRAGSGRDG